MAVSHSFGRLTRTHSVPRLASCHLACSLFNLKAKKYSQSAGGTYDYHLGGPGGKFT